VNNIEVFKNVGSIIALKKPRHSVLCFNPKLISSKVSTFINEFPGTVSWALKSNPHPAVVQSIIEAGVTEFDVSSKSEIEQVRTHLPNAILHFNHPIKPPEEISYAYFEAGVRNFVVDCIEEVEKIISVFHNASKVDFSDIILLVRFMDPDCKGTGNYNFGMKFGADPQEAAEIVKFCLINGFNVGIAFHTGSQNRKPEMYTTKMNLAFDIARKGFGEDLNKMVRLNVGGGFPCIYPDGREPELNHYFEAISKGIGAHGCEIICEPGRALVSDSMSLLTRITLKRKNNSIYLNDGFYGSFMESNFVDFMPPVRAYDAAGNLKTEDNENNCSFEVWGPTCDSLDKFNNRIMLPSSIETGDYIEFGLMGAYTNATATRFNGIEQAEMVIVDDIEVWTDISYN
jgi:ornithine decarboxylase